MPSEARLEHFLIWTMKKQHIKEIICRAKQGKKKIMEKLNRAQKCSILGPQNLGSRGGPGPRAPPPGSAPGAYREKLEKVLQIQTCYSEKGKTFCTLKINTKWPYLVLELHWGLFYPIWYISFYGNISTLFLTPCNIQTVTSKRHTEWVTKRKGFLLRSRSHNPNTAK